MKHIPLLPRAIALLFLLQSAAHAQQTVAPLPLEPTPLEGATGPAQPGAVQPGAAQPATTGASPRSLADLTDDQVRAMGQGPAFPYSLLERVMDRVIAKDGSIVVSQLNRETNLRTFERAVALADFSKFPVFEDKEADGTLVRDRNSELAFRINAYNGLFLKAIGDAYPLKSVAQIKDLDTLKRTIGGQKLSFAEMRRAIAAVDTRALFVLIDGTSQGPRAPQGPLRYSNLGRQLNASIKAFVDDPSRVSVPERGQNSQVLVSPWLQSVDEFFRTKTMRRRGDGVKQVLAGYVSNAANKRFFGAGDYQIRYLPANSNLNEAPASASLMRPTTQNQ